MTATTRSQARRASLLARSAAARKAVSERGLPCMPWEMKLEVIKHAVRNEDGILVARGHYEKVGRVQGRGITRMRKSLLRPFSKLPEMHHEAEKAFWPENEVVFPVSTRVHSRSEEACWDQQLLRYEPELKHVHFIVPLRTSTPCRFPARATPQDPLNRRPGHIVNAFRMIHYAIQNCTSLETLTIHLLYDANTRDPVPHGRELNLRRKLLWILGWVKYKKSALNVKDAILVVAPGDRVEKKAEQSHGITLSDKEIAEEGKGDLWGMNPIGLCGWMADRFYHFAGEGKASRVAVRLA
ncbi:hypothetical protein PRZ48_008801 [Zasmidium cellare]|uniref:Uncharacterized protein n=1 Tax=Zasmidium cellare TaxID=395010 RepID=A0ABR0EGH4_ZASCE|nr:hypothetical protein PRZ48_008801 [Zasmidium cellare]